METTLPTQDDYRQDDRPPPGKLPRKAQARPDAILWNTPELAAYLNVKETTIRYWVHIGYIPYIKFQSLVRFRKTDIDAWLDQRTALGRTAAGPMTTAKKISGDNWSVRGKEKGNRKYAIPLDYLVAGAGFEPATFGL